MYKERTGGHNRSSTKEKRNTYPPLFSKLRRENALAIMILMSSCVFHYEFEFIQAGIFV